METSASRLEVKGYVIFLKSLITPEEKTTGITTVKDERWVAQKQKSLVVVSLVDVKKYFKRLYAQRANFVFFLVTACTNVKLVTKVFLIHFFK